MSPTSSKNILIVDDEMEVCMLLQNFLSRKSHQVAYSLTLKDALDKCGKLKPEILLLDHNMPDGAGIQHISTFKQLHQSVRIIVISAMSNLKSDALSSGADYFLEKPVSFGVLNEIIAS